jgi:imidazolonepropionase-like amidohydrolase
MMKRIALFSAIFLFIASLGRASDQIPAPPQDHPIALVGGTVHTVSGQTIENGTVLFDKGVIVAVGRDVPLPGGTEVIRVDGLHVFPGLVAMNTILGLTEIGSVRATQDYSEMGEINPNVRAEAALNPDSELLPVARWNGITIAQVVPRGGLISGRSAAIVLDGWTWEDMTLEAPVGLHIQWPSAGGRRYYFMQRSRESRERIQERIEKIKRAFAEAKAYLKAKQAETRKVVPFHESDVRWEAMIPFLKGEKPVFIHANDLKAIEQAITWGQKEGLKMVLVGGRDAWRVPDLLKENDVPVVVTGTHRLPSRQWEPYDEPFTLPVKLYKAGIRFCIAGTGNASAEGNLPYHAATAVAFGLPEEEAIRAITLYPAQILGIADRVGSIEKGKDATLIVTTGSPLDVTTRVKMEFIQGRKIDLTSKHTQLYVKYKTKYERMKK